MTLDEARAIAKSIPDIQFSITCISDGLGMAVSGDISLVENMATRLPILEKFEPREHMRILNAFTSRKE